MTTRILFVDDEDMLVLWAKAKLTLLGYSVIGMSNGIDAIACLKEKGDSIDILITDQTMPGMTGIELAKEALKMKPPTDRRVYSREVKPLITACLATRAERKIYGET